MKIPREYMKWSTLYHLDAARKIKVVSDYRIRIEGSAAVLKYLAPIHMTEDFDKTLTAKYSATAYELYDEEACRINTMLDHNHSKLQKTAQDIDNSPSDFSKPLRERSYIYRTCCFKEWQHKRVCENVADNKKIKIVRNAFDAFLEQQELNCIPGINTGSPEDAVREISKKRIGLEKPFVVGSIPLFDKSTGDFSQWWLNLGTNKIVSMGILHMPHCYCDFSLTADPTEARDVYTTDDLSDFERHLVVKIGSLLGFVVHAGNQPDPNIGEFVFNAPEIRDDLMKLNYFPKLYRRARLFPYLHNPRTAREIINTAEQILYLAEKYESDYEQFLGKVTHFLSLNLLFPYLTYNVMERCRRLRSDDKIVSPSIKKEVLELVKILRENDPAFHATDKRKADLAHISP